MRSAICLPGTTSQAWSDTAAFVLDEFKRYAEVRTKYYREEQRWPESEFWLRRHAGADFGRTIAAE